MNFSFLKFDKIFNKNLLEKKEPQPTIATIFKIEKQKDIIRLPELRKTEDFDFTYSLIKPYAQVHIFYDAKNKEIIYQVEEPELDNKERDILNTLENGIRELINLSFVNIKDEKVVLEYLEKSMRILLNELKIIVSEESFLKMMYYVYRNFIGLNEIEPLMNDYFIEDIECNGFNTPIYIVHRKYRNLKTNIIFKDNEKLTNFVEKLAQKCGKYISYANPLLDGKLPDGSRVNATYTQDISTRGPTFTIRKFSKEPWTPIKLIDFRTVPPEHLAYLWIAIEFESNIMIIGGTGSGKTSFLNALAFFIPPKARVVSIEDTRELSLMHENWLPSVAREGIGLANIIGQRHGEVSLFDLLKESFRQRPDYVIVGEIRGKEAFVLFQGASSGHPSFSTMHAEDVDTMIKRLETEPINLSPALIESLDIVCIMAQAKVGKTMVRRVKEINEIINVKEGKARINTPFIRDPREDKFYFKLNNVIFNKIVKIHGIPLEKLKEEFINRTKLLMHMYENGIYSVKEVQDIINEYYKDPIALLRKFKII